VAVVALAGAVVVAVWSRSTGVGLALGAVAVCLGELRGNRRRRFAVLAIVLLVTGAVRSEHSWNGLAPDHLGPYEGWARLVDDPKPFPSSTRVVFDIEGERFEMWSRGRAQRQRIDRWRGGDVVTVSGTREALEPERARRTASQHVVGEFRLEWASDMRAGSPIDRASNQVRSTIERGASWMPDPYGALFRGLVIGDDRDQPPAMIGRFRASGLSHLTAVSGQNVSFMLAACGPILVRLGPRLRWVATVALIGWFVALTRFEPSILRAGAMAMLSATAFVGGRERAPIRLLALAILVLVIIDPLLVWSVGFWLSTGATAGVCSIGPVLARRFERFGVLAVPLGVTLGAQAGVVLPSLLVFGRLPLVSVPANLLAVPVAGAVMLYGMPAALLAGLAPMTAPVVMLPALLGTKWVDTVAVLGARLEPEPRWAWVGWAIMLAGLALVVVVSARSGKNRGRHDDTSTDR
jgi:competence protein ComEC